MPKWPRPRVQSASQQTLRDKDESTIKNMVLGGQVSLCESANSLLFSSPNYLNCSPGIQENFMGPAWVLTRFTPSHLASLGSPPWQSIRTTNEPRTGRLSTPPILGVPRQLLLTISKAAARERESAPRHTSDIPCIVVCAP